MKKYAYAIIVSLFSLPAFADGTFVQHCNQNNSTFFPTTTASCTLTGTTAGHYIIVAGFSCTNTCEANCTQATHALSDTKALTYTQISYTTFANNNGLGNWAGDSLWCAPLGASSGNDTATLTLNASSGNGIEVEEWSALSGCNGPGTGSPVSGACTFASCTFVQSLYGGRVGSPHTFTGGTITIVGAPNVSTVLGSNGAASSSFLISFASFPVTTGNPLLVIYDDCDNCGDLFGNIPAGYTKRGQAIGDNDSVFMTGNARGQ